VAFNDFLDRLDNGAVEIVAFRMLGLLPVKPCHHLRGSDFLEIACHNVPHQNTLRSNERITTYWLFVDKTPGPQGLETGEQVKVLKSHPIPIVPIETPDRFTLIGRIEADMLQDAGVSA
jgi:hypothetical protein